MLPSLDDTIAAIASPAGEGARGIVRVSGPETVRALEGVFRPGGGSLLAIERATVAAGEIVLEGGAALPCEVYLWLAGHSYTGQPVAEIHTLGSRPLLDAVLGQLCLRGARLAERGEFTLRAFLSGRLDLTQAEAVLGVIDAADGQQLDVALGQLAGGVGGPLNRLRDRLLDLLAHLEAGFDFADEDLPFITTEELQRQLEETREVVSRLAARMDGRGETRDLAQVALIGWPNTGKSSLFNALLGRRGALVSDEPGTTRDYLTAELTLEGLACLLTDTAGVEPAADGLAVELWEAAQSASAEQRHLAQVQLLCLDATRPMNAGERALVEEEAARRLVVWTKVDAAGEGPDCGTMLGTSSVTGEGMAALRRRLSEMLLSVAAPEGDVVAGTAVRCRESLRRAGEFVAEALAIVEGGCAEELVAAEVRGALEELGKVVGAVYTDDVLDRVFSRFCVGK